MRSFIILPILAIAACAAPTNGDDTAAAESATTSTRWQATIRCDDGSVLDVNADERRELQFVIRNKDAVFWMQHSIECNWSAASCPTNGNGEMIFRGRVDRGVWRAQDFDKVLATHASTSVMGLFDREGDTVKLQIGEYYNWIFRGCH